MEKKKDLGKVPHAHRINQSKVMHGLIGKKDTTNNNNNSKRRSPFIEFKILLFQQAYTYIIKKVFVHFSFPSISFLITAVMSVGTVPQVLIQRHAIGHQLAKQN